MKIYTVPIQQGIALVASDSPSNAHFQAIGLSRDLRARGKKSFSEILHNHTHVGRGPDLEGQHIVPYYVLGGEARNHWHRISKGWNTA